MGSNVSQENNTLGRKEWVPNRTPWQLFWLCLGGPFIVPVLFWGRKASGAVQCWLESVEGYQGSTGSWVGYKSIGLCVNRLATMNPSSSTTSTWIKPGHFFKKSSVKSWDIKRFLERQAWLVERKMWWGRVRNILTVRNSLP